MHLSQANRTGAIGSALAILLLAAACSSGGASSTPTPEASASSAAGASASEGSGSTGDASLDAPAEVGAGEKFEVKWTGPNAQGDYVTIVAASATKWTNEPYFYTSSGSPGSLVASITDGAYAIWYVDGATETILARKAIRITPFEGALGGPEEVEAGTTFEVSWNGPDGPGDYVTILAAGTAKWTNESYFYTSGGNPGKLVSPIEPGAYELWYVTGADDATMASKPITVTPYVVTLDAPDSVQHGAQFEVVWTGPNGPSDYITIVPAGSAEGAFASYAYTNAGSPAKLTAPDTAGNYEIWYASDRVKGTFAKIDIVVK